MDIDMSQFVRIPSPITDENTANTCYINPTPTNLRIQEIEVARSYQGKKLLTLPCWIGDKFYTIEEQTYKTQFVKAIKLTNNEILLENIYGELYNIGEDAFLYEEDAKRHLNYLKGETK